MSSPTRARPRADALRSWGAALVDPPPEGEGLGRNLRATPLAVWLFLLGLTGALFSGWSGALGLPISLDRVFLPVALVLLLLDGNRPRQRMTAVHWLVLVFVTWIAADMLLRDNVNSVTLFALLDRVAMPFLLFLTGPLFFTTPFRRRLLLAWLTGIGAYLGVLAVAETVAPSLVFPRYIANPDLGMHFGRARGPFLAGDAMGLSCLVLAACAAVLAVRSRGWVRLVAGAVAVLDVLAIALSLTRAVWVGAVLAAILVVVLVPAVRRYVPVALVALAAGVALLAAALPNAVAALEERFNEPGPVYDRLGSNDSAMALLRDLPLTGIGWRRFYPHGAEWFRQSDAYPTNKVVIEIHNVLLSRAAELGLVAAAIFVLILLLGPGRTLWDRSLALPAPALPGEARDWRVIGAIAFTGWFVTGMFGPMAIPFPSLLTFLVCGVACAGYLALPPDPSDLTHERDVP